jgi:hypothetical protein
MLDDTYDPAYGNNVRVDPAPLPGHYLEEGGTLQLFDHTWSPKKQVWRPVSLSKVVVGEPAKDYFAVCRPYLGEIDEAAQADYEAVKRLVPRNAEIKPIISDCKIRANNLEDAIKAMILKMRSIVVIDRISDQQFRNFLAVFTTTEDSWVWSH